METVFSHIIRKRLSRASEDVATDALAYILDRSEPARRAFNSLLAGISPELPSLRFRTQTAEGAIRPDMWGDAETGTRAYIENKFWAGLTDNQPVAYLKSLGSGMQPAVLLVIAPSERATTLWRELQHRLSISDTTFTVLETPPGCAHAAKTELGPTIALTSWRSVLEMLRHAASDEPGTLSDLAQLRALCHSEDLDAFLPLTKEQLSDQGLPAFLMQLSAVVNEAVAAAVAEGVADVGGLRPQSSLDRMGRYVKLLGPNGGSAGAWIGINLRLWKLHGETPLWMSFSDTDWGRARELRPVLAPGLGKAGITTVADAGEIAVGIRLPAGEERDAVIRAIVRQIKGVCGMLDAYAT